MENELWDKLEMFVGTPLVTIAIPHYVNEMEQNLTAEQLAPLGNLTELLTDTLSKESDQSAKKRVQFLIHLAKNGVIKKKA